MRTRVVTAVVRVRAGQDVVAVVADLVVLNILKLSATSVAYPPSHAKSRTSTARVKRMIIRSKPPRNRRDVLGDRRRRNLNGMAGSTW